MNSKIHLGARVSILATFFDVKGQPRWSENVYGDTWRTARVFGVVAGQAGAGKWRVHWDDGDEFIHPYQQLRRENDVIVSQENSVRDDASERDDAPASEADVYPDDDLDERIGQRFQKFEKMLETSQAETLAAKQDFETLQLQHEEKFAKRMEALEKEFQARSQALNALAASNQAKSSGRNVREQSNAYVDDDDVLDDDDDDTYHGILSALKNNKRPQSSMSALEKDSISMYEAPSEAGDLQAWMTCRVGLRARIAALKSKRNQSELERLLYIAETAYARQEMSSYFATMTMILEVEVLDARGPEAADHIANLRKGNSTMEKLCSKFPVRTSQSSSSNVPKKRKFPDHSNYRAGGARPRYNNNSSSSNNRYHNNNNNHNNYNNANQNVVRQQRD